MILTRNKNDNIGGRKSRTVFIGDKVVCTPTAVTVKFMSTLRTRGRAGGEEGRLIRKRIYIHCFIYTRVYIVRWSKHASAGVPRSFTALCRLFLFVCLFFSQTFLKYLRLLEIRKQYRGIIVDWPGGLVYRKTVKKYTIYTVKNLCTPVWLRWSVRSKVLILYCHKHRLRWCDQGRGGHLSRDRILIGIKPAPRRHIHPWVNRSADIP